VRIRIKTSGKNKADAEGEAQYYQPTKLLGCGSYGTCWFSTRTHAHVHTHTHIHIYTHSGRVYKCLSLDGKYVAVKQLTCMYSEDDAVKFKSYLANFDRVCVCVCVCNE
jgi:hypothetical protein